jgi:hypothetical protein
MDQGSVTHPAVVNNPPEPAPDERPGGDAPVLEGTAVEETPEPGTAVAVIDGTAGAVIRADEPTEILAKAQQIATPLAQLIESAGLAKKLGGNRKHVEVGGWQAAGTMLGALGGQALHAETVWTRPVVDPDTGHAIRNEHGFSWEACVEIRTPAGVVVGKAEAMCGRTEKTWAKRDDYAVRSMAETRAESRAYRRAIGWIVHLAGYNPTPAEEMGHEPGQDTAPVLNDWQKARLEMAEPIAEGQQKRLALRLAVLVGAENDEEKVDAMRTLWKAVCAVTQTKRPSLASAAVVDAIVDAYVALYPQAAERLQPRPPVEPPVEPPEAATQKAHDDMLPPDPERAAA